MNRQSIRAAVLLAVMVVLQSLRLIIPMPPFISLFIFGSAVNACLLLSAETTNCKGTMLIAILAPLVSFLQQAMPMPAIFLPVAIITNVAYILVYQMFLTKNRWFAVCLASVTRLAVLYVSSSWALHVINIPSQQTAILQAILSWPQLITGIAGGIFCWVLLKRLPLERKTTVV